MTLTRAQVRDLDRRAIAEYGVPGVVLMENAGRGAADVLTRLNPDRRPVAVLCGKGNNGGDGYVIARHLDLRGWPVRAYALATDLAGDALVNFEIARRSGLVDLADTEVIATALSGFDGWVVDALFGTGLSGPVREPFDRVIDLVNASRAPVLAVDLPSGLDCDNGEPLGPTVRAVHTVTFVAAKAGFANPASQAWTGEVHVADIGAPRALLAAYGVTCSAAIGAGRTTS